MTESHINPDSVLSVRSQRQVGGGELIRPEPKRPVSIRVATADDLPFIDALQRAHSKAVSFWPRMQLENYIKQGDVLIAEGTQGRSDEGTEGEISSDPCVPANLRPSVPAPLGYIISRDRYFKREDVGIIYQLVVSPGSQRSLVGAALVQAVFERSAYGCKLYCCWCAQDLPANHFWESIGFVPIAFRAGSERKQRMHIFWQKRIRAGDVETPWWFPSQTSGGAIREGRLVLPIPPGTHWSDAKPTILPDIPGVDRMIEAEVSDDDCGSDARSTARRRRTKKDNTSAAGSKKSRKSASVVATGGFRFGIAAAQAEEAQEDKPARSRARRPKVKRVYHPDYVAAARELCARYLEEVQAGRLLPEAQTQGKYDVTRQIEAAPGGFTTEVTEITEASQVKLLDAA